MSAIEVNLCHGCAGWYVQWFRADDAAPLGYRLANWYGSREACERRMKAPPPRMLPVESDGDAPPYDAATASGAYDR